MNIITSSKSELQINIICFGIHGIIFNETHYPVDRISDLFISFKV